MAIKRNIRRAVFADDTETARVVELDYELIGEKTGNLHGDIHLGEEITVTSLTAKGALSEFGADAIKEYASGDLFKNELELPPIKRQQTFRCGEGVCNAHTEFY